MDKADRQDGGKDKSKIDVYRVAYYFMSIVFRKSWIKSPGA